MGTTFILDYNRLQALWACAVIQFKSATSVTECSFKSTQCRVVMLYNLPQYLTTVQPKNYFHSMIASPKSDCERKFHSKCICKDTGVKQTTQSLGNDQSRLIGATYPQNHSNYSRMHDNPISRDWLAPFRNQPKYEEIVSGWVHIASVPRPTNSLW